MLISCVAYQDGTKLGDILIAQIPEYMQRPHCFVWVALNDPTADELAEMQKSFDLHPLAVEDALVGHQRPKVEEYGDSLFAVLHLVEPAEGDYRIGELAIFAGATFDLWAAITLFRERTTILLHRAADRLVTCGPFRMTRNPIYVGNTIAILGLALAFGNGAMRKSR